MMPLAALVTAPAAALPLAGLLTGNVVLSWSGVPVGVILGGATYFLAGRLATARLTAYGPELLTRIRGGKVTRRSRTTESGRPMPVRTAALCWTAHVAGFVVLVMQVAVPSVLHAAGSELPAAFAVGSLPAGLRIAALGALAVLGAAGIAAA